MHSIKASLKLAVFCIWTLLIAIPQVILLQFTKGPKAYLLPYIWENGFCKIFGLKVNLKGTPYTESQTIYISNHISYLDIPVIASVLKASFVAKADVEKWPVLGFLSKLQQTAFISRRSTEVKKGKYDLSNMLLEGKSLIIFPEGTSSDGKEVLPFKSSLFSIALEQNDEKEIFIQPITLSLVSANGRLANTQEIRDLYAWHGDMTLAPHLWAFLKGSGATINLYFHAPFKANEHSSRKDLAHLCFKEVQQGLEQAA
jgi:1-acyl-sn-glycerol-3-phosphate acyltransferase